MSPLGDTGGNHPIGKPVGQPIEFGVRDSSKAFAVDNRFGFRSGIGMFADSSSHPLISPQPFAQERVALGCDLVSQ